MYKLHRTLEGEGQTQPEPGYCAWATPANSLTVGAVGSSTWPSTMSGQDQDKQPQR